MPSGLMIPARNMPPIMTRNRRVPEFGSSSGLSLLQTTLMENRQNLMEKVLNSAENEVDSKSGSDNQEGASGDDQALNQRQRKKPYVRHNQHQIQEMESFFKECPHPDDKQRKELSRELGLDAMQIKFWFQNKRTQTKNQQERHENTQLRAENEKLRIENMRYKEALSNTSCPTCGGPTTISEMSLDNHNLAIENARLREEIERISSIAGKYLGKPMSPFPPMTPRSLEIGVGNVGRDVIGGTGELFRSVSRYNEGDKQGMVELAVAAMEELVRMAQIGEPLWTMTSDNNATEILNEEEYIKAFPRGNNGVKPIGMKSEATRETALVFINHFNLVEIFMDVNQWSNMFSGMVSRASTVEILSTGVAGNYNGALQVISVDFQFPSPLVPSRENMFIRFSKQNATGSWVVVDVSMDSLSKSRRRPSGCLIQEFPNGYSKVIWVEHVEADDQGVHDLYKSVVNSGLAFGAKRWVSTLERKCERLASVMGSNIRAEVGALNSQEGRMSMLKITERMAASFCTGMGASAAPTWSLISGNGAEEIRMMSRKCIDDPGRPTGIAVCATTSFWLPVPPAAVFYFIREDNTRNQWDILSNGGAVQEMAHFASGRDPGNAISVYRVNSANMSQSNMLIIQETFTDSTGSYLIYAPIDIIPMNVLLNGGNPDHIAILPSGFAIFPDGPTTHGGGMIEVGRGGTIVTASFQILVDSCSTAKLTLGAIATVNNLVGCTVGRIKAAFPFNNL